MRHVSSLLLLFLVGSIGFAQENVPTDFTLVSAQTYAIEHSPTVKNAALDVGRAESDIKQIRATGLPQISGSLDFNSFIDIPTSVLPANAFNPMAPEDELMGVSFGVDRSFKYGFSASQLIFSGPYLVGLQAADLYRSLSEQQLKKTEQDIKKEVEQLYIQILVADEIQIQVQESIELLQDAYESALKSQEQGMMEKLTVDEIRLQLANTEHTMTKLAGGQSSLLTALKFYMGIPVANDLNLTEELEEFISDLPDSEKPTQANVQGHIDYQIMLSQKGLAELDLKKEKYTLMPSVGAFFSHSQDAYATDYSFETWYPATIWGVQVKIPIFNSFAQKHLIDKASLNVEKAAIGQTMVEQSLAMNIEMAANEYKTNYSAWKHQEKSKALAHDIYKTNVTKFNAGAGDSGSVTESHGRYLMAEADYYNAVQQLLLAKIKLHHAIGAQ